MPCLQHLCVFGYHCANIFQVNMYMTQMHGKKGLLEMFTTSQLFLNTELDMSVFYE